MHKRIKDLTGQTFGELTVLEYTGKSVRGGGAVWLCKCSCGTLCEKTSNYLQSQSKAGRIVSCGHGRIRRKACRETHSPSGPRKWPGQIEPGTVFGELTAIQPTAKRASTSVVWECKCSCGKTCYVRASCLKSGQTRSCGHLREKDYTGLRSGRLVAVKAQKQRDKDSYGIIWLCRCDCGGVKLITGPQLRYGAVKSCGCLGRKSNARCPGCGKRFPITLDGTPTPQFCPDCASLYAGQSWRVCPVCHKLFPCPPSSNAVTCSKPCSAIWKSWTHKGLQNKWSDEARQRLSAKGRTENLKLGTAAAQQSPIAGRFETNQEAKVWVLIDPTGQEITVRNLNLWARENTDLFGKPEGDHSAQQIASGFRAIAQTLRGKRKTPVMTYFGWTLKCPPEPAE